MIERNRPIILSALMAASVVVACASIPELPPGLLEEKAAVEENTPLGGEALSQRKLEMKRAYKDLVHFHVTFESLHQRKDRNGLILFAEFTGTYMGTHLQPLLRNDWQSEHPEVMGLDANLRFIQAEVLMQMNDPSAVQTAIDEIERRFAGRENMLVDYPIGDQSPLGQALQVLRDRKWRG
jgi:hypothetical protein